jgi:hypothetical protein
VEVVVRVCVTVVVIMPSSGFVAGLVAGSHQGYEKDQLQSTTTPKIFPGLSDAGYSGRTRRYRRRR